MIGTSYTVIKIVLGAIAIWCLVLFFGWEDTKPVLLAKETIEWTVEKAKKIVPRKKAESESEFFKSVRGGFFQFVLLAKQASFYFMDKVVGSAIGYFLIPFFAWLAFRFLSRKTSESMINVASFHPLRL